MDRDDVVTLICSILLGLIYIRLNGDAAYFDMGMIAIQEIDAIIHQKQRENYENETILSCSIEAPGIRWGLRCCGYLDMLCNSFVSCV